MWRWCRDLFKSVFFLMLYFCNLSVEDETEVCTHIFSLPGLDRSLCCSVSVCVLSSSSARRLPFYSAARCFPISHSRLGAAVSVRIDYRRLETNICTNKAWRLWMGSSDHRFRRDEDRWRCLCVSRVYAKVYKLLIDGESGYTALLCDHT